MKHAKKNQWYVSGKQISSAILLGCLLLLSACGGAKIVKTVDQSADYKSAKSLPPLKKPSNTAVAKSTEEPVEQTADAVALGASSDDDDERIIYDFTPESSPESAPEAIAEPSSEPSSDLRDAVGTADSAAPAIVDSIDSEQNGVEVPDVETSSAPGLVDTGLDDDEAAALLLTAKVIAPQPDVARLQIEADFDSAWEYLSSNLKKSDLTVFSRNQVAGRYSIGCADIEVASVVEKRGGWSFLTKKAERHEYCALQAVSTKGATVVTVLNRAGEEVSGAYANKVFDRILNN